MTQPLRSACYGCWLILEVMPWCPADSLSPIIFYKWQRFCLEFHNKKCSILQSFHDVATCILNAKFCEAVSYWYLKLSILGCAHSAGLYSAYTIQIKHFALMQAFLAKNKIKKILQLVLSTRIWRHLTSLFHWISEKKFWLSYPYISGWTIHKYS